jgi:hypothetical protein
MFQRKQQKRGFAATGMGSGEEERDEEEGRDEDTANEAQLQRPSSAKVKSKPPRVSSADDKMDVDSASRANVAQTRPAAKPSPGKKSKTTD